MSRSDCTNRPLLDQTRSFGGESKPKKAGYIIEVYSQYLQRVSLPKKLNTLLYFMNYRM